MKYKVGNNILDLERPVVMGILNVTPDSFFSESRKFSADEISARVKEIHDEGAAIIDIGGYSTRPGAEVVEPAEELRRVALAVEAVRENFPEMIISIDTFRSEVAKGVIENYGQCIINDVSAGELDPAIIETAALHDVPYIAMHMRGKPENMQQHTEYSDVVGEIVEYLFERARLLKDRGINKIILDPGFGFAKTTAQNYELLARLGELTAGEFPVLAGLSRKSMIYKVLDTTPADSFPGTVALNWECLRRGAKILRVHDVKAAADIVRLFNYYEENGQKS